MALAVIVFARLWYVTHKEEKQESGPSPALTPGMAVEVASPARSTPSAPSSAGPGATSSPACNTLDRALGSVVLRPGDATFLADAKKQLEACTQPPARACEIGAALDARAPLTTPPSAARELLGTLCERCSAEHNPCAVLVSRALQEGAPGRKLEPPEVRWNLEHAGPGTQAACSVLVREVLAPAALSGGEMKPSHPALLTELAPVCAKAGHLPVAVVNAAIIQRGAQAGELAKLAVSGPVYLKPSKVIGPEGAQLAFDGSDKKAVELSPSADPHQAAEGALSARFEPPLRQLTGLRVLVKGAGTVRALVRAPKGVGLQHEGREAYFVNPTVCQFQGTGQYELCALGLPLLEVEALAVVPSDPKISVYELDMQGIPGE